jgi:hypothetical protein
MNPANHPNPSEYKQQKTKRVESWTTFQPSTLPGAMFESFRQAFVVVSGYCPSDSATGSLSSSGVGSASRSGRAGVGGSVGDLPLRW